jgi:hypothetical protein
LINVEFGTDQLLRIFFNNNELESEFSIYIMPKLMTLEEEEDLNDQF